MESAIVLASPRDLTAGWSYTALSRARGQTRLLVHDDQLATERSEFAPEDRTTKSRREELLERVQRRMLERDDEDLAIEQLQTEQQLQTQLDALPTQKLRRMDDLRSRADTLSAQQVQLTKRLASLPEPRRRFGREQDERAAERANLRAALDANKQALDTAVTELASIERDLGDPARLKSEQERLTRTLRESRHEQAKTRAQSVERDSTVDLGIGV